MKNKILKYINQNGLDAFKYLCYCWSNTYEHTVILDSCSINTGVYSGRYEFAVALGAEEVITSYQRLIQASKEEKWLFGIMSYDLKNEFETLASNNRKLINTSPVLFFVPKTLVLIHRNGDIEVIGPDVPDALWDNLPDINVGKTKLQPKNSPNKQDYLNTIDEIHDLIRSGEVYELNYCLSFEHHTHNFKPVQFHFDLLKKSPVPMASFMRNGTQYMCGASMERYLYRNGSTIASQPIKGTISKGKTSAEDEELTQQLYTSTKDRAENVMIVDLVRNDLAKVCKPGSVKVDELFGIYSYLQVHQMISTVSGELKQNVSLDQILKASFPMGSMTGTPKISAMKHIERLEDFSREWYSGALGYIQPNGNFDFNVVIRTLFYDQEQQNLHYCAGGAITIDSEPEKEWQEIEWKTRAITELLNH